MMNAWQTRSRERERRAATDGRRRRLLLARWLRVDAGVPRIGGNADDRPAG